MNRPDTTDHLPENRTIRSSRLFAVEPGMLWMFFENGDELGAWWGPSGFTNAFREFGFRDGGAWRFVMRGPDGAEYEMNKEFVRIEKPRRIVLDHIDPVHGFRMFIDFVPDDGNTRLDWTMVFDQAEEAAKVRPFVGPANEENFDRLGDRLAARTNTP